MKFRILIASLALAGVCGQAGAASMSDDDKMKLMYCGYGLMGKQADILKQVGQKLWDGNKYDVKFDLEKKQNVWVPKNKEFTDLHKTDDAKKACVKKYGLSVT
jgi:hypothetical protein